MLLAIDPGNEFSAYVVWDGERLNNFAKVPNADLLEDLRLMRDRKGNDHPLYIEMIASYGMPVGKEVFETCVWIGRFMEAYGGAELVYRLPVKQHHCHSVKANDATIRTALIDRFGGKGTKKAPGVTYGLSKDVWQAFALAVYAFDTRAAALTEEGAPS